MTERDIFIAALQKEDPAQRQAFLDEACAGQPELRQQVEDLLRLHEGAGSFLDKPAAVSAATGAFPEAAEQASSGEAPGTIIGPYKLIEPIGEGGMGKVWMAQQTEPVKRLVAVKLIKAGMDSKQVIARFEAERQALALMDHPNIAKVLDGGTTSGGRPYFVMDLVKGVPITKYCDEHHLTPRQRLELFVPVCQAIQHAHQKGIIHRDIKPSNVLIALYDGKPVPKVIDFGVAKATGQALTEKTLVTGFGNIVGTLEYMSPEQAEVNQLDIDTRSDIYSLGVLLYELLAGSPPFSRKQLEKAGVLEMLRVIREEEPSKPSTKLSTAEGLPTLAANRGTKPAKLTKLVRGELDWIVMKALEKDRGRRYETANGFAMDVQRYLADEPVLACPPSFGYRLRKFARRNGVAITVGALLVFMLVMGTAVSAWQAIRADQRRIEADEQRAEADQQRRRAQENLQKVHEAVEVFFTRVNESRLVDEIGVQPLRNRLLEAAVAVQGKLVADFPNERTYRHELGRYHNWLGVSLANDGQLQEAEQEHRRGQHIYEQLTQEVDTLAGQDHRRELAWSCINVGGVLHKSRRYREAQESFRQSIALCEKLHTGLPGQDYSGWLSNSYSQLAIALSAAGQSQEAEKEYRRILELKPNSPVAQNDVAWFLITCPDSKCRQVDRALELAQRAGELLPPNGYSLITLGIAKYRRGDSRAAISDLKKSTQLSMGQRKAAIPVLRSSTLVFASQMETISAFFLAMAHWKLDHKDEAREWYNQAVKRMDRNRFKSEELLRFRAEAEELMGVNENNQKESEHENQEPAE